MTPPTHTSKDRRRLATAHAVGATMREAWREADAAGLRIFASSIAYRALFSAVSLLSALLLVAWTLGVDVSREGGGALDELLALLPPDLEQVARERAGRAIDGPDSHVVVAGALGLGFALWGAAGGFAAVYDALNRVFDSYRYTRLTMRYARGMAVALGFVALAGPAFLATSLGTRAGLELLELLHLDVLEPLADGVLRTVASVLLGTCAFALVLRWGSRARPPWHDVLAASLVAGGLWAAMSGALLAFAAFVEPFSTYGSLASAVAVLLYGYWTAYLLLLAALFSPLLGSLPAWLAGRGSLRLELAGRRSSLRG